MATENGLSGVSSFPESYIKIEGARENNLRDVDLCLPTERLVVFTGRSGSGKSSLVMDTLLKESQRCYAESLSAYSRQFMHHIRRPRVKNVENVLPAIAVNQTRAVRTSRSTVGTFTDIYNCLKILFSRLGVVYTPQGQERVVRHEPKHVVDFILGQPSDTRFVLGCQLPSVSQTTLELEKRMLSEKGYTRSWTDGEVLPLKNLSLARWKGSTLLIDRGVVSKEAKHEEDRWLDSARTAMREGDGFCQVHLFGEGRRGTTGIQTKSFSNRFELNGLSFLEPSPNLFTFNSSYGACPECQGTGMALGVKESLVVPDARLSVAEGAIAPWRGSFKEEWLGSLGEVSFPVEKPYERLSEEEKRVLWRGKGAFRGLNAFFDYLEAQRHKVHYRVLAARYRADMVCPSCQGFRLRKEATYVKLAGYAIGDLVRMPVSVLRDFFNDLSLPKRVRLAHRTLMQETRAKLNYLSKVGLGHLTLDRPTHTLSGGEYQRIRLANCLGSHMVGAMYVLDEPTVGLHPRDTQQLVEIILALRNVGNTLVVVEHEELVMKRADVIVDMGPEAGEKGGCVTFCGPWDELLEQQVSTAQYLNGKKSIPVPKKKTQSHTFSSASPSSEAQLKERRCQISTQRIDCGDRGERFGQIHACLRGTLSLFEAEDVDKGSAGREDFG